MKIPFIPEGVSALVLTSYGAALLQSFSKAFFEAWFRVVGPSQLKHAVRIKFDADQARAGDRYRKVNWRGIGEGIAFSATMTDVAVVIALLNNAKPEVEPFRSCILGIFMWHLVATILCLVGHRKLDSWYISAGYEGRNFAKVKKVWSIVSPIVMVCVIWIGPIGLLIANHKAP